MTDSSSASISLSILIPLYNWDVRKLLQIIHEQALEFDDNCTIEIIVVDDGSEAQYDAAATASKLALVDYIASPVNQGRGAVRNMLLNRARGDYVLFLDADMLPDSELYLVNYVKLIQQGCDVVCGGISYKQHDGASRDYDFYHYKSRKTEAVPAVSRRKAPWRYLFTSNVVARREILKTVTFDQRFTGYGYEDIEWAIRLHKSYRIEHIDNTCTHMGLMTKIQVFEKMRESIENYALLLALHPEVTGGSKAAKLTGVLKNMPETLLHGIDVLLTRLYYSISWCPLVFVVFQCDKMVLLAKALKKREASLGATSS